MFLETSLTRDRIDDCTKRGYWTGVLLNDFVDRHAAGTPEKVALKDRRHAYSYKQLAALRDSAAAGLLALGVKPGDVVSVQLPNWVEFAVAALATKLIGAVVNPLSVRLRHREMTQILSIAQPAALIVPDRLRDFDHLAMALELRSEHPSLKAVVALADGSVPGATSWESLVATAPIWPQISALLRPDPNAVAALLFTSGTTGQPKGVLHTHNTLLSFVNSSVRRQRFGPDEVVLMPAPVTHGIGFYWGVCMPLRVGGTVVYQAVWDPVEALQLMEQERVTYTIGSPTHLRDLLEAPDYDRHNLESLRLFMCGGANLHPPLAARASEVLSAVLSPVWGMTENGVCTALDEGSPVEKASSTDGFPQPEVELRIVDGQGTLLPSDEEGRLQIRTPFNFIGYIQGRAFTAQYVDAEGWFDTGDLAYLDADGYLRMTGRTKDLVIRGGINIPVKEIEDLLEEDPRVREIAIVAVPDERLSERACACIVGGGGKPLTLADLSAILAAKNVTKQYWPEYVLLLDSLPRTDAGKVQKFKLRDLATERLGLAPQPGTTPVPPAPEEASPSKANPEA